MPEKTQSIARYPVAVRLAAIVLFVGSVGLPLMVIPGVARAAPPAVSTSLENSDLVVKGPDGTLGVARKDGTPIDGVKLSQYDQSITTPRIAVTSDGMLHVAFVERSSVSPFASSVYYRQSADGGASWTEAKDLSMDMPKVPVGECNLLADGDGRVYVIWRCGLQEGYPVNQGQSENLVYRVLDHGKWSAIIPVHPPGSPATQNDGSYFSFACVDGAGRSQVIWNTCPDHFLPNDVMAKGFPVHLSGIGNGLVFQATLDGSKPSAPKQIAMAKVSQDPNPNGMGEMSKFCDDYSALDGYVDAAGTAHFIAIVRAAHDAEASSLIEFFDGDKRSPAIRLPSPYMEVWTNPPKLLVDAKGRHHVITLYNAGAQPVFSDCVLGSDDKPVVILAPKNPKRTCLGFQAYQGPNGRMAVVMQTSDAGLNDSGDSWVSLSTGDAWAQPVCVTNNAARARFASKQLGIRGSVGTNSHYGPGPGAVAFDKQGHLLLALCNIRTGSFALSSGLVTYNSDTTSAPILFFYKF